MVVQEQKSAIRVIGVIGCRIMLYNTDIKDGELSDVNGGLTRIDKGFLLFKKIRSICGQNDDTDE